VECNKDNRKSQKRSFGEDRCHNAKHGYMSNQTRGKGVLSTEKDGGLSTSNLAGRQYGGLPEERTVMKLVKKPTGGGEKATRGSSEVGAIQRKWGLVKKTETWG